MSKQPTTNRRFTEDLQCQNINPKYPVLIKTHSPYQEIGKSQFEWKKKAIDTTTKMIKMLEFTDKYLRGDIIKMQQAIMNEMKWKVWKDSAKKHDKNQMQILLLKNTTKKI